MDAAQILLLGPHIAAALVATAAGGAALCARKGGPLHARAGRIFLPAIFAVYGFGLAYVPFDSTPDPILSVGAIMGAYLVATSWQAARRRDGTAGSFEPAALGVILFCLAADLLFLGLATSSPTGRFYGHSPATIIPNALIAALAAGFDIGFILRGRLSAKQRLARHVWRISVAMLMVTFATFAGDQVQKAMPEAIRGSMVLTLPPLAVLRQ